MVTDACRRCGGGKFCAGIWSASWLITYLAASCHQRTFQGYHLPKLVTISRRFRESFSDFSTVLDRNWNDQIIGGLYNTSRKCKHRLQEITSSLCGNSGILSNPDNVGVHRNPNVRCLLFIDQIPSARKLSAYSFSVQPRYRLRGSLINA